MYAWSSNSDGTAHRTSNCSTKFDQNKSKISQVRKGGEEGYMQGFLWESQKERDHYDDLNVGGRIIFKWILQK
jgi:hypothetical protein